MHLRHLGSRLAALGLLASATAAALGYQQLGFTRPAVAADQTVAVDTFEPAMQQAAAVEMQPVAYMPAAAVSGQFEELVKPTPVPTAAPTVVPTPSPTPKPAPNVFESGIASTYGEGDGFEGNLTACGQVFHTSVPQVAHKSLPCGTMVRVEDANSGRSVVAQVTDRGPYVPGRIVDLSWGAFRQLQPDAPGLLHVNVYLVDGE